MVQGRYVFPFSQLRMTDVDRVGGKNASLGELLSQLTSAGIRVPDGFATTAEAFRLFLKEGGLEERIAQRLTTLDVDDVKALAAAGAEIRGWKPLRSRPSSKRKSANSTNGSRTVRRKSPLPFALPPRLKTFPTPPSPVSRKRCSTSSASTPSSST